MADCRQGGDRPTTLHAHSNKYLLPFGSSLETSTAGLAVHRTHSSSLPASPASPASYTCLLSTMPPGHLGIKGPGDLGLVGRHRLGRGETLLGLVTPSARIPRISYPYLRLTCAAAVQWLTVPHLAFATPLHPSTHWQEQVKASEPTTR